MKITENRAFVRHTIEVRGLKTFRAEFSDVRVALIIRQDNDEVGFDRGRARGGRANQSKK